MARLPKITRTHRWDRELLKRVESLAQRTGRPVQHILDDSITIGLAQIEEAIDARMRAMTPAEAWEAYVGSQTPQEFWELSHEQGARTYYEAAERYARDLPNIFREDWAAYGPGEYPDLDRVADLLARYLEQNLGSLNERSGSTMAYAEAVQQLVNEGYTSVDYGDGWTDLADHLNSLEDAAYETEVVIQQDPNREGVLEIVALDERGYLKSEPLAWVKR